MASFFPARCGKTSNGSGEGQQLGGAQTVTETGGAKMGGGPTVGHALANWRVLAFPSGSCIFESPRQSLRNRARPGNSIGYGLYTFLYIHIYIIFELISISIYLYIYTYLYPVLFLCSDTCQLIHETMRFWVLFRSWIP